MSDNNFPMHVGIVVLSAAQLSSVYALLGGASPAVAIPASKPASTPAAAPSSEPAGDAGAHIGDAGATAASGDDNTVDAHGWPWSADLHASTKGQTKEGLWRMKVGVSRPDPKPGFPKDTGTAPAPTSGNGANASPATQADPAPAPTAAATDDEDEFAAFRAAAAKSDANDASAKASVPERKWTDADLGALCNQAAVKLGDPAPVKALIAEYVPEGEVPHSRNIPEDKRQAFASAVEAKAGIEFAG